MFGKRRSAKKKYFLIESSNTEHRTKKKFRNRFLNTILQIISLKNIGKNFRWMPFVYTGIFLMTGFVAFALLSPFFHLQKISFVRDTATLDIEKIQETLKDFYGKNLFLISQKNIKKALEETFPEFREIKIREKWPKEIELAITQSPPFVNILNAESADYWLISEDGVLLQNQADPALPTIKLLQHKKKLALRDKLFNKEILDAIMIAKTMMEKKATIKIKEILYLSLAKEVHLITLDDTEIWLDLLQPFDPQIEKLLLGVKAMDLENTPIQHIDLRIPDQIFWKKRE